MTNTAKRLFPIRRSAAAVAAIALLSLCATAGAQGPAPEPGTPEISAKLSHSKIHCGQTTKLSGSVSGHKPGTFVELQQRHGHSWRNVARAELRLSGRFSFTIRGRSKGKFNYRVWIATTTGFRSAASKTLALHVD